MEEIPHLLRLVVYPIICKGFSTIPGGDRQISSINRYLRRLKQLFTLGFDQRSPSLLAAWVAMDDDQEGSLVVF